MNKISIYQDEALSSLFQRLAAVRPPIETSATLPPMVYSDHSVFELEKRWLFCEAWIGVGRADRWKSPGDYSAIEVAGTPIVVLYGRDRQLRAFANSCRHRGAKLLSGEGSCEAIRCPFHRWTYALDGRLLGAPKMDQAPQFNKSEYGLIPVRIEVKEGFVFVCLNKNTASLDEWLGDFGKLHAPWSLSGMVSTRRREFEVKCNWKIFLEVFNEYYHLPYVHPDTLSETYGTPEDPDRVTGNYVTQFGSTQGSGALLADDQSRLLPQIKSLSPELARGVRYTWAFPNMTFAAGGESIWVYEVYPTSPDRTWVGMTVCFPQDTLAMDGFENHAEHYYHRMDSALDEDIPAIENQQAGVTSALAAQGRFSYLEPSVANFACWYAEQMLRRMK